MNNRQKIILAILNLVNTDLNNEIAYFMEIENEEEEPYDIADAFSDVFDTVTSSALIKPCHQVMIEAGYLVEQPVKPISNGADSRITVNKIKYDFVSGWSILYNSSSVFSAVLVLTHPSRLEIL